MAVSSGSSTNNFRSTHPSTPLTSNGHIRIHNVLRTLCTRSDPRILISTRDNNRTTRLNTQDRNSTSATAGTSPGRTINRCREYWADRWASITTCRRWTTCNWTVTGQRRWSSRPPSITGALRVRSRSSLSRPTTAAAQEATDTPRGSKWFSPTGPARVGSGPTWTSTATTRAYTTPTVRSNLSTVTPPPPRPAAADRSKSYFPSGGRPKTSTCSAIGCPTRGGSSFSFPGLPSDAIAGEGRRLSEGWWRCI